MATPGYAPFYRNMSAVSLALFFGAVFCIFAPMMVLSVTAPATPNPTPAVVVWWVLSGAVAVGWAASFMFDRRWLWLVVPLQVALVLVFAARLLPHVSISGARVSVVGLGSVVLLVSGYVFLVRFIAAEGVQALRLQTEMNLAQRIHAHIVPPLHVETAYAEIVGRSTASSEMGGDLIDSCADDHGVNVFLADVSGHGVRAGVLMAMIKSILRTRLLHAGSLRDVIRDTNRVVCDVRETGMFATFAGLHVDPRQVTYGLAGHLPVLHYRAAAGDVVALDNAELPLGVMADVSYDTATLTLAPGDVLAIYSDGLTEAFDANDRQLGIAGFTAIFRRHAALPLLPQALELILADARAHATGAPDDDQSLILVRKR